MGPLFSADLCLCILPTHLPHNVWCHHFINTVVLRKAPFNIECVSRGSELCLLQDGNCMVYSAVSSRI